MEFIIKTAQPVPAPAAAPAAAPALTPATVTPKQAVPKPAPGMAQQPGAKPAGTPGETIVATEPAQQQPPQPQAPVSLKQKRAQDPNLEAAIRWLTDLEKASGSLTTALDYLKRGTAGIPKEDADLASVAGTLEKLHEKLDTAFRQHFGAKQ